MVHEIEQQVFQIDNQLDQYNSLKHSPFVDNRNYKFSLRLIDFEGLRSRFHNHNGKAICEKACQMVIYMAQGVQK